jgi:hypothetical protein
VNAATVVADHAAERASAVCGGIRAVGEVVEFSGFAEAVEDDARLDDGEAGGGVERGEAVEVAGEVKDDGDVGGLSCDAGTCSTRKDGCADCAACGNGSFDVGSVAGQNDTDGKLTVVGGVGCIKSAGCEIEANFSAEGGFEAGFEIAMGGEVLMIERRLAEKFGDLERGDGHGGNR